MRGVHLQEVSVSGGSTVISSCIVVLLQVLRVDISTITTDRSIVDSALHVCFAPSSLKQLLVVTSTSRLLKLDSQSGVLLSEVCTCFIFIIIVTVALHASCKIYGF